MPTPEDREMRALVAGIFVGSFHTPTPPEFQGIRYVAGKPVITLKVQGRGDDAYTIELSVLSARRGGD